MALFRQSLFLFLVIMNPLITISSGGHIVDILGEALASEYQLPYLRTERLKSQSATAYRERLWNRELEGELFPLAECLTETLPRISFRGCVIGSPFPLFPQIKDIQAVFPTISPPIISVQIDYHHQSLSFRNLQSVNLSKSDEYIAMLQAIGEVFWVNQPMILDGDAVRLLTKPIRDLFPSASSVNFPIY